MVFRPSRAYSVPSRPEPEDVPASDKTPTGVELDDVVTQDIESRELYDFPDEVEPQPVVVVEQDRGPYVNHGTFQLYYLFNMEPVKILSNYYGRRMVFIRNTSNADMYLSNNSGFSNATSFELSPGHEMTLRTTDEVWAFADGTRVSVYVEIEGDM